MHTAAPQEASSPVVSATHPSQNKQPIHLVTALVEGRFVPLAFFPRTNGEAPLRLNGTLSSMGATFTTSKSKSHQWNVVLGPHMARDEYNKGMNEFSRAILAIDSVSWMMSHRREADAEFVHDKYRLVLPPLDKLVKWIHPTQRQRGLSWEYCECGCHCHHTSIGTLQFSVEWRRDLSHLRIGGHGRSGRPLGMYPSWSAIDERVLLESQEEIVRMKNTLRKLGAID